MIGRADRRYEQIGRRSKDVDSTASARTIPDVVSPIDATNRDQSVDRATEHSRKQVAVHRAVALIAGTGHKVPGDRDKQKFLAGRIGIAIGADASDLLQHLFR